MKRLTFILLVCAYCAFALSGCLFEAREANPPSQTGGGVSLDEPAAVFTAIKNSMENLLSSNYESALKDDFVFRPSPGDESDPTFDPRCVGELDEER